MEYRVNDSICPIWGEVIASGDDCTVVIKGGCAPHVGTVVLAIPRPSLTGEGISATVSCINRTGHMDDAFAVAVAKRIASERGCVVACSCGIHIEGATPEDLAHIKGLASAVSSRVLACLEDHEEELA